MTIEIMQYIPVSPEQLAMMCIDRTSWAEPMLSMFHDSMFVCSGQVTCQYIMWEVCAGKSLLISYSCGLLQYVYCTDTLRLTLMSKRYIHIYLYEDTSVSACTCVLYLVLYSYVTCVLYLVIYSHVLYQWCLHTFPLVYWEWLSSHV